MSQSLRVFIAVELNDAVRRRARELIAHLKGSAATVKWTEPENLHFTLQFLGQIPVNDTAPLCAAVQSAVQTLPPFQMFVQGAGAFPAPERPRIVWLGVQEGVQPMTALHDAIEQALQPLGYREENRRYTPHMTLGRVRGSHESERLAQLIAEKADFEAGLLLVEEVTVFASNLSGNGPRYEPLSHALLDG